MTKTKPTVSAFDLCEQAIREGRNAPTQTVCQNCCEWVDGIWHVTLDHKRICLVCSAKLGIAGAAEALHQAVLKGVSHAQVRPD